MNLDKEMQRALEADGEKLRAMTGEDHGPWSPFRLIFDALARNEISAREAVEQVLYHPEYGGNREDAESVVEEWSVQIDQQEERAALDRRADKP